MSRRRKGERRSNLSIGTSTPVVMPAQRHGGHDFVERAPAQLVQGAEQASSHLHELAGGFVQQLQQHGKDLGDYVERTWTDS